MPAGGGYGGGAESGVAYVRADIIVPPFGAVYVGVFSASSGFDPGSGACNCVSVVGLAGGCRSAVLGSIIDIPAPAWRLAPGGECRAGFDVVQACAGGGAGGVGGGA